MSNFHETRYANSLQIPVDQARVSWNGRIDNHTLPRDVNQNLVLSSFELRDSWKSAQLKPCSHCGEGGGWFLLYFWHFVLDKIRNGRCPQNMSIDLECHQNRRRENHAVLAVAKWNYISNKLTNQMQQFSRFITWRLCTAQHISGVLTPIIRSSTTAVAASGFTVGAWW